MTNNQENYRTIIEFQQEQYENMLMGKIPIVAKKETIDLKPCPFCGSEKLVFADEDDGACCIRCTDCGAQVGHYMEYMSDNEDIAGLWNRRADE